MHAVLLAIWRSALVVILRVIFGSLLTWLREAFCPRYNGTATERGGIFDPENPNEDGNGQRNFIFVEFNAWECAGSDVLWASLITKIFDSLRATGFLRTSQTILQDVASKGESVGASYRGFTSEVKEELEILFEVINKHNADRQPGKKAYSLAIIIDDLDRCPKQQIMDMMQATHLLLEQPRAPLAVFLAVDPRLIASAVAEVLDKVPDEVTGLEYLDKIIHIPFCLPQISKRGQTSYLDALLDGNANSYPNAMKWLERHIDVPDAAMRNVERTLEEFKKNSRSIISRVKYGPELLDVVRRWEKPELTNVYEHFKFKLDSAKSLIEREIFFEELNAEEKNGYFAGELETRKG